VSSDAGAIVGGSWKVVDAACRIEEARQYESMFTQGNGYLSVRGSLEEGFSDDPQDRDYWRLPTNVTLEKGVDQKSVLGTFIPSVTGVHPLLNEQMANLPWFFDLRIECAGESLDVEASRLPRHCRVLDMRTGLLLRVVDWTTPAGVTVHLRYRRFVSAAEPHLSVLELHARTDGEPVTLTVRAGLDARVRTSGYNHFRSVRAWSGDTEARLQVSTDAGAQVVQRCALEGVEGLRGETHESCVELVGTLTVDGRGAAVLKRIAVANSADDDAPEETTASVLRESRRRTFRELYRSHRAVWQERWCRGDVRIEGEPAIQHAVRFSLYHLLRAVRPGDDTVGIDPKAASSAAYFGRFFWDTELYLLPFFLYTDPEAARSLVAFRCRTLDGARENARAYGYPGARYAWESAPDGTEQCPNWQYADHEIHVTADVVYGIRHYVRATGDRQFLFREALPVLVETARYWLARVDWLDGCAHLLGVMGPDEYAPFSNDNYYTNRLVKLSLDYTEATLAQLQDSDPRSYGEAVRRLRITEEERREFRQTAAACGYRETSLAI
jgi:kojibiose phosphorylase